MRLAIVSALNASAPLLSLFLLACGPEFDPPSELHSLRVLAVNKDKPYAQPGETVNLQMLWQDASPRVGRKISISWSPPCFDPPGDLYYACFSTQGAFGAIPPQGGERTSFDVPLDIISQRPPAADGSNNAPYGITYMFFTLCAGELALLPASGDATDFPIGCKDADGNLLGADDFVAGYTAIYSFEGISNNNPKIAGFEFRGQELPAAAVCLGDDCLAQAGSAPPVEVDCDDAAQSARCIPTCADDGDPSCTAYAFRPIINKDENQDIDEVSAKQLGRTVGEQMWVNYYTDAGGFKSAVRLLNDATNGWNDDYGTEFYAPKAPGLSRIWAVAHDNRGGAAWAGITVRVQ